MDSDALGLLGVNAGEPGGAGARVVATAVAQALGRALGQLAEHEQVLANGAKGLMVGVISKPAPSVFGIHPSESCHRHVNKSQPDNRFRRRASPCGNHGIEQRQSQRVAKPAQESAAIQGFIG